MREDKITDAVEQGKSPSNDCSFSEKSDKIREENRGRIHIAELMSIVTPENAGVQNYLTHILQKIGDERARQLTTSFLTHIPNYAG